MRSFEVPSVIETYQESLSTAKYSWGRWRGPAVVRVDSIHTQDWGNQKKKKKGEFLYFTKLLTCLVADILNKQNMAWGVLMRLVTGIFTTK